MSNKYLGHSGGLIGPVETEHPVEGELNYGMKLHEYLSYLDSFPRIPCEGWKPEEGKEYVKGVDFELGAKYPDELDNKAPMFIALPVAIPLPNAPQLPELDHPEEGAAYLQPALNTENNRGIIMVTDPLDNSMNMIAQGTQTPAANDGGDGKRIVFPEFNASVRVADNCPDDVIQALRKMCEIAYNTPVEGNKNNQPEKAEWYKNGFGAVLEENYQAQIAGFYNDDKTDEERAKRQAVITEYEDLIAIWKAHKKSPAAAQEGGKTNDPFVQKHLSRIKLGLASVGATSVFIPCMPQDEGAFNLPNTNTWLREIKFDSIEAPQEGAQELRIDLSVFKDSGIPELEEILKRFQNKEFDIIGLIANIWNKAYAVGKSEPKPVPAAVADPWIPVTNPPERHVKVLVMDRIIRVFTGHLSLNGWLVNYSDGARYASTDNPITHWQPLPQPPKQ